MSKPIIEVQHLAKKYHLGAVGATTLREDIGRLLARARDNGATDASEFWALRDLSFTVQPGEVVGIVGSNGAGKSTLLKILSRITEPTSGRAILRGRVASLLEVGTGFHPDLTGRENVFLNGAILGMRHAEIARRFDEIVSFAEVEKFIDSPVKHYSSGMHVRLAFAVAAHLESEIMIVDEVLAVGDASFQRKCLGKMTEAGAQGRTILFVSHNTGALLSLCHRGVLLRGGKLEAAGAIADVVQHYLDAGVVSGDGEYDVREHALRSVQGEKIIQRIFIRGQDGQPTAHLYPDEPFAFELHCAVKTDLAHPRLAVAIEDQEGRRLLTMASYFEPAPLPALAGATVVRCTGPGLQLAPGRYFLSASIGTRADGLIDSLLNVASFEIRWRNNFPSGEAYLPVYGPILRSSRWTAEAGGARRIEPPISP